MSPAQDKPVLKIYAESIETYVLDKVSLSFPPPYVETAARPESFEMRWKWLTYVFDLPDPATAPAFTHPLADDEQEIVERYMLTVQDLLESSLLSEDQRFSFSVNEQGMEEKIRKDFLSREITRGVTVLLRQMHSPEEAANFNNVCDALAKHLRQEPAEVVQAAQEVIAQWRKAHNKLQGQSLMRLVRRRMNADGLLAVQIDLAPDLPPERLISMYQYGDIIHWGKKRGELANVAADPVHEGMYRMNFMDAMFTFAHIYLGFSKVIGAMTKPSL